MRSIRFIVVLLVPIVGFFVVVGLMQGDCGQANLFDRLTTTPALISTETRQMNAALAAAPYAAGLSVESISGHKLTLLDRNAVNHEAIERDRFRSSGPIRGLAPMWQSVFARNHNNVADPTTTIDVDFGNGPPITADSSLKCVAT